MRALGPATWPQRISLWVLLAATAVAYLWNLGINGWANSFYSAAIQAGSVSWKAFLFGSSDAGNSITVDKPPAFLWIPELSVRIFGLNSWSILVPEALMGVASVAILYLAVTRISGRWVGLLAGLGLAVTPVALLMFRFDNPEALLILLSVSAVYGVVRAVQVSFPGSRAAVSAAHRSGAAGARAAGARRWWRASTWGPVAWLVFVGVMMGLGFLTKQLQAWVIVPTLALAYLTASRATWPRRFLHLLAAAAAMIVSAGWWVALVELWPADSRPYIGGSEDNSFLNLTFGYNGLGRLSGDEAGSVGSHWGTPSLLRLVQGNYLTQISWLLPTALLLLVAALVLVFRTRAWRQDAGRARIAGLVALGGWFVVEALTISLMHGITHEYYTAILAAPIAGTAAIGAGWLWERRTSWTASITLAVAALLTAGVAVWILNSASWGVLPGVFVAVLALIGACGLALRPLWSTHRSIGAGARSALAAVILSLTLVGALGSQSAFAASTTTVAKTGSIIYAGSSNGMGPGRMGGMGGPGGGGGGFGGQGGQGNQGGQGGFPGAQNGTGSSGTGDGSSNGSGSTGNGSTGNGTMPQPPGGTSNGSSNGAANGSSNGSSQNGAGGNGSMPQPPGGTTGGTSQGGSSTGGAQGAPSQGDGGGMGGGMGGLLDSSTPSSEVTALLSADASKYTWAAAAIGSQNAAGYQLATQLPVMPVGGFNGTDNSPTLEQFKQWVSEGKIHYFISSGSGSSESSQSSASGQSAEGSTTQGDQSSQGNQGGPGGGMGGMGMGDSGSSSEIQSWVQENFTSTTVDGVTLYDLTSPTSSSSAG